MITVLDHPWLATHGLHNAEFLFIVVLFAAMLYVPPKKIGELGAFIERHYGDSVGIFILLLGISLVIVAGVWQNMQRVGEVGYALVTAAMGVLKLTKTNGTDSSKTDTGPPKQP